MEMTNKRRDFALTQSSRARALAWRPEAALLLVPTALLTYFAAGDGTLPGDVWMSRVVQDSFPTSFAWIVQAVNAIGGTLGAILLSVAVGLAFFLRGHRSAGALVLATLAIRPVNSLLKLAIDSPRPSGAKVQILEFANGLGFPSGHVMGATLFYGAIAYLAPHVCRSMALARVVQGASIAMIVMMGISRIHVGAHWPSDVIGGYLWGSITLFLVIIAWNWMRRTLHRNDLSSQSS